MEGSSMEQSSLLVGHEKSDETAPNYNYSAIFGEDTNRKYSKETVLGNVRNPKRFTWVEWSFLILSIVAFTGTLVITVERFVSFKKGFILTTNDSDNFKLVDCNEWTCISDFTFTILLIVNIIFCFFYAIDGVLRERGFEILAIPVAIVIVLIYIIGNYIYQTKELKEPFRIARLILACLFAPPLGVLAVWIYIRNGTLQFNIVGSNKTLMRVYRVRSFVMTLLTFNLHLLCNFVPLVLARDHTFINEAEKIIIVIFIFYMVIITPIGWCGFVYEVIWLTAVFGVFFLPTVAVYIYKIINVGMNIDDYWYNQGDYNNHLEKYRFICISLFVVSSLGVIVYLLIIVFTFLAATHYKEGLNEKRNNPVN